MDLALELKKRLDYRQKVADELSALDRELSGVVTLIHDEIAKYTGQGVDGSTNGLAAGTTDMQQRMTLVEEPRRKPGRQPRRLGEVSGEQIETFLVKRVDKAIDVNDLVTRFGMKRNSATTRLWNLAKAGRIVKTGPGTYYVPGDRNDMSQTG